MKDFLIIFIMIYILIILALNNFISLFNMTSTIDTNMLNSNADANILGKTEENKDKSNNKDINEGK